jgi:hypothetical protein
MNIVKKIQQPSFASLWKLLRKDQSRTRALLTIGFVSLLSTNLIDWLLPSSDEN